MQVTLSSFPSNLQSTATQALNGAVGQWNTNCGSTGGGGCSELCTSAPTDGTYFNRFTVQHVGGTHPDPGLRRVCGSYESSALAYVYAFMRTGPNPSDIAPCPLDDPTKLQHIIAHEIGHRYGLSDATDGCGGYIMSPIPAGAGSTSVQPSECSMADSLNSTAAERGKCDHPTDCHQSPILLTCRVEPWALSSLPEGVWFDFDGDGDATRTAWTLGSSGIAFLYSDLDGTHCAETGGELFGDARRIGEGDLADNGFEALSSYDSNFDGVISPADNDWGTLRLWLDESHEGLCTPEETMRLDDAGVVAIALDYHSSTYVDPYGNEFRYYSVAWCRRGTSVVRRVAFDVFFLTSGQD